MTSSITVANTHKVTVSLPALCTSQYQGKRA